MEIQTNAGKLASLASMEIDWKAAYEELLPRVFHYFAYRLGDSQIAEDLTATTFERAWKKRARYRNDLGGFQNWIFGIARRVASEYFRKSKHELPIEHAVSIAAEDTDRSLEATEDFTHLKKLLAELPLRERELVSLKYGAEMNNRAIARLTKLSESNVGTILSRVVTKLRKEWENRYE